MKSDQFGLAGQVITATNCSDAAAGDKAQAPTRPEFWFAVVYLVGTLGGFTGLAQASHLDGVAPLLFLPLYAWLLIQFWLAANAGKSVAPNELIWLFVLGIGLTLSAVTSYKPAASFFNVILLFFDLLFALWLVHHVGGKHLAKVIVFACATLFILAIPIGFVSPDTVIYNDPLKRANVLGFVNIKGLFPHKIHAGIYSGIAVPFALLLWKAEGRNIYRWIAAMFFVGFLASGSSVALVSFVGGGVLAWLLFWTVRRLGWPVVMYGLLWLVFGVLAIVLLDLYPTLMKLLGRDPNLTGRVTVWLFALKAIAAHPWLGQGFGVFFDPDINAPAQGLWRSMPYYAAPSFHSGYLQLLAEAGFLGGGAFFVLFGLAIKRCIQSGSFLGLWIVFVLAIANLGAALFITHRSLLFVLMVYFAFQTTQTRKARLTPFEGWHSPNQVRS